MSSYLLLRNNQESGPFTMDEIRAMALKPYDLIWVAGKSAAWRYPGEIPELKPFAPPVPESSDSSKRMPAKNADTGATQKTESASTRNRDNVVSTASSSRSIYVNLPAEKKVVVQTVNRFETEVTGVPDGRQTENELTDFYSQKSSGSVRFTGKILWISTIILLFGMGILTGFFISDRRKFFSSEEKAVHGAVEAQQELRNNSKENPSSAMQVNQQTESGDMAMIKSDSTLKQKVPDRIRSQRPQGKTKNKSTVNNVDSIVAHMVPVVLLTADDSLKMVNKRKTAALYQKIKSHPENYVNLTTGRFTTGVFGGISSFPVTVTNNSAVLMDEIVVTIDYIQHNEKVYKSEHITFNDLEAGETVTIKAPKSSRGIKISTRIHIIRSRQLDLSYSN